jgi:hypothetical protein
MIGYSEAPEAWARTDGMARRAGVDLSDAVFDGWLKRAELAALIAGCETCRTPGDCERLLGGSALPDLPSFCAIRADIQALAPDAATS